MKCLHISFHYLAKARLCIKVAMTGEQYFPEPGLIILFGSGETSPTSRKIFETIFKFLPQSPRLALLETPAGFELNSHQVISRIGDFFTHGLQNYNPQVEIIKARKRGTQSSPDSPEIVNPLLNADLIFLGPGSPSYAIRQLSDSLAWYYLIARHRLGAVLALASAAAVAFSAKALPVYEIYKAGADIHWIPGLDFFKLYGLQLAIIPHWNNHEGGVDLDTSRCFMGQERFVLLMQMLPEEMTIIGLDEKTALIMDPSKCECQVKGLGMITLLHKGDKHIRSRHLHSSDFLSTNAIGLDDNLGLNALQRDYHVHQYRDGQIFPMSELGPFHPYNQEARLPASVWQKAIQAKHLVEIEGVQSTPEEVILLIQARQNARHAGNWECADELRQQIQKLGWEILDTKDGPVSRKL
jgi:cyanophycinase-like exopeptidase